MQRLTIVVPYRDREAHLAEFVPHVRQFFAGAKPDRRIPYRALIVEQEPGLPFNRGALKNIGFLLGREGTKYTAFHDVDYLPLSADYSWTEVPTPIVWYGAENRPIAPGRSSGFVKPNLDKFFGGAVLVPNRIFQTVDGYSNAFWGWGWEDTDLARRFVERGIGIGRRKGRFRALDHDNEGYTLDAKPNAIAQFNQKLFDEKWNSSARGVPDGLSTVAFEVIERSGLPGVPTEWAASWEKVTVRLKMAPLAEQLAALAAPAAVLR